MKRQPAWVSAWIAPAAVAAVLAGCERSQSEPAREKKADAKASSGTVAADKANVAAGWTAGDDNSWQTQIRSRTQGQNEYARITGATPAPVAGAVAPAAAETSAATQAKAP